jgi:hypothetical protein
MSIGYYGLSDIYGNVAEADNLSPLKDFIKTGP